MSRWSMSLGPKHTFPAHIHFFVRMIIYKMTMKKKVIITINTSTFPHQAHVLQFSNIFQHFVKSEQIKQTV